MQLTEAGEAFLPHRRARARSLSDGRRIVNAFERGGAGRLALGAAPARLDLRPPDDPQAVRDRHPRVRVSVRTGHSEEVLELVLREQVDLGLVRELRHPDIVSTPLYEDSLVLVVDPAHRFAERGEIRLEEIAREQLVLFDRTSSYTELTNALFRAAGVRPDGVMELDNIDAAKKMVQLGLRRRAPPPDRGRGRDRRRDGCGGSRSRTPSMLRRQLVADPPARPRGRVRRRSRRSSPRRRSSGQSSRR